MGANPHNNGLSQSLATVACRKSRQSRLQRYGGTAWARVHFSSFCASQFAPPKTRYSNGYVGLPVHAALRNNHGPAATLTPKRIHKAAAVLRREPAMAATHAGTTTKVRPVYLQPTAAPASKPARKANEEKRGRRTASRPPWLGAGETRR